MTIQAAIKKAIEYGYRKEETWLKIRLKERPDETDWTGDEWSNVFGPNAIQKALLDPKFWQCLGKAMGWEERIKIKDSEPISYKHIGIKGLNWFGHWHSFIDYLAEGKSAEDYFRDLK